MGVTFWRNFASCTLLVPFHWCGMCDAHHAVDMPDRGSYWGLARTVHSAQCGRAKAVRPARWSRRAMIPSPLLRRAVVAALAALAITWPVLFARAQAQPREGLSRTSPSGSYLAARHAGGQRDVAAAASYYRAALREVFSRGRETTLTR